MQGEKTYFLQVGKERVAGVGPFDQHACPHVHGSCGHQPPACPWDLAETHSWPSVCCKVVDRRIPPIRDLCLSRLAQWW